MTKGKRTYEDACGIARALDAVGDRWALMIVRELLLGPKRFSDIRAGLPKLSADVLSQRLRELEEVGVVGRRTLPPPAPAKVYELTPAGLALEPVLIALGRWGGGNAAPPADGIGMSFDSHILSLRTLFSPERAEGLRATYELRLDTGPFRAAIADGVADIGPGDAPEADAVISGTAEQLFAVVRGARDLAEAEAAGDLEVSGDRRLGERFFGLFPLPEPARA
jgi:DNA-binding HxlR family transcriptional regulator